MWGLYTQRKPGIDGGRTATLTPEELEDEYFMLRVRIDGGQLTTEQLRVIAGISTEFGRDTADLTDRQNIQLHWIEVEAMPEIWRRLESVGLGTTEYRLVERPGTTIEIRTGDIARWTKGADVWVNSENTNLQMARFYERSLSATIRYRGAKKNEDGEIVEDTVANELVARLKGGTPSRWARSSTPAAETCSRRTA